MGEARGLRAANLMKMVKLAKRPYLAHNRPLFFAHRGGSLLAPENTMAAFERGVSHGADALEVDLQTTSEGEIVVIHDPTVDRTTEGAGPVSAYTLAELRRLDAGYRFTIDGGRTHPFRGEGLTVPTLREVFARFLPATRINIDMKESTPARERRLWDLIQEYAAYDRVGAGCEDAAAIARFRRMSGGRVATAAASAEARTFLFAVWGRVTRWLRVPYDALQIPEIHWGIRVVSPALIAAAHRRGLAVTVRTVDQ